ncbi:MAG TPA: hypothetical protein VGF86_03470 [Candidatus Tumulicola sp.]
MPEAGSNVELAHDLSAHGHHAGSSGGHAKWLGFVEAFVLAIVAVSTAWSGYQASRWNGVSTTDYALYERYTVLSQEKATLAGQDRLYDIVTFNGWVAAKVAGHEKVATFYERRFRPEYEVAFKAWMKLDPIHNLRVPAGPIAMPEYRNANALEAVRLEGVSARYVGDGIKSREQSDDYVRVTVFLATALFLTALSQRFEFTGPRVVIVAVAATLLLLSVFWILRLPRA